jgi:hypothetical protein
MSWPRQGAKAAEPQPKLDDGENEDAVPPGLYTESGRRRNDLDEPERFIGGKEPFGYHPHNGLIYISV